MDKIREILSKFGLSDKEIGVYLTLLRTGPSPVRKIAVQARVNRGTTYDILKSLRRQGLVSYYHQEKHQYFVAEDPKSLFDSLDGQINKYESLKKELREIVPRLRSISKTREERPVVTYYDGAQGVRVILKDVLEKTNECKQKEYYAYSSLPVRNYLYAAFPDFNEERLRYQIKVKVIALGQGGELAGLDKRKWLTQEQAAATYTLIYINHVAMISVNQQGLPIGLIISDPGLYHTQKLIFESLWQKL